MNCAERFRTFNFARKRSIFKALEQACAQQKLRLRGVANHARARIHSGFRHCREIYVRGDQVSG